jgi:hypothetical protein
MSSNISDFDYSEIEFLNNEIDSSSFELPQQQPKLQPQQPIPESKPVSKPIPESKLKLTNEINKIIIMYNQLFNPQSADEMKDYDDFINYIEYCEEIKRLPEELQTDSDKQELAKYATLPYDLEFELLKSVRTRINSSNTHHSATQKIDTVNHYINTVSDVKKRSKLGIPQVENITATKTITCKNEFTTQYKGQIETQQLGEFTDVSMSSINMLLSFSCYELLPYASYNAYGCEYAKTCFNTIGRDYEYISPFIDYDLSTLPEGTTIIDAISTCHGLVNDFLKYVLPEATDYHRLSIIGYSNIQAYQQELIANNQNFQPVKLGYEIIQHKPNSGKALSLHIVFADIKIHVLEFIARINNAYAYLSKYPAFDKAPYLTGTLRHMGSPKTGLSDHPEDKQVLNLTDEQKLDQFITYYNTRVKLTIIKLNPINIHNKEQYNPIHFNTTKHEYSVKLIYGGQERDNIESIIKMLDSSKLIDSSFSGRWSWLGKYVMYKKSVNQPITKTQIDCLLNGEHDHLFSQITFLNNQKTFSPHPNVLLSFIKQLIPNEFDYTITDLSSNNYVQPKHFGQHKVEDMIRCKTFKELIEVLTGSFALASNGKCYYNCKNGIQEYSYGGRPNAYVAKFYPSCLRCIISENDLWEDDEGNITQSIASHRENVYSDEEEIEHENELLNKLFKHRLAELGSSKRKKEIILSADVFIKLIDRYFDEYNQDGITRFKLNGYSVDKVDKEAYEDVKAIIKLFENRLVKECKTYDNPEDIENRKEIDNPIQEFLRSIKYLLVKGEKPEKGFIGVDTFGATGKSLFFSKIIKDFFGLAGLNDDSLNCLDSTFTDTYNYLFTVYNEVEKGKHTIEQCSSKLKQFTDNTINGARVKCVQDIQSYKNNGIYVLLSNSETLNGAFDFTDTALMSRYVLIEFEPFENNGNVDALKGSDYYSLVDKYKAHNDRNHIFMYKFRNALYKYIMDLDISTRTFGRAQPSQYKVEKYTDLAKDRINELIENDEKKPYIMLDSLYNLDLEHKILTPYTKDNNGLVAFQISKLFNIPAKQKTEFIKALGYKSALYKKTKYTLNSKTWNTILVICDKSKLVELLEVRENININGFNM